MIVSHSRKECSVWTPVRKGDEKNKTISILDIHDCHDLDIEKKLINLANEFKKGGRNYGETERHELETRYVGREKRTSIHKNLRSEAEQQVGRENLRDLYQQAEGANEEFLNKQTLPG